MCGTGSFTESLFTMRAVGRLRVAISPLARHDQPAPTKLDGLFARMYEYEADDRPSIAPKKLLRAMLVQLLCSSALGMPDHGAVPLQTHCCPE